MSSDLLIALTLWVGLSIVVAVAANTRGRDAAFWLFLATFFSPLLAGLLLLALPRRKQVSNPVDAGSHGHAIDDLQKLIALRDQGEISADEFARLKSQIIG